MDLDGWKGLSEELTFELGPERPERASCAKTRSRSFQAEKTVGVKTVIGFLMNLMGRRR